MLQQDFLSYLKQQILPSIDQVFTKWTVCQERRQVTKHRQAAKKTNYPKQKQESQTFSNT